MASSSTETDNIPSWKLAREGVNLLINNKPDEAKDLFKRYPDSIEMYAGYSFGVFMDALMGFEEDKLTLALTTLRDTENRCTTDHGWLKSMKSRVFGAESSHTEDENLERQIILADSQVCLAILLFLQQDFSSCFKGGWILRKSWKLYQHAYNEIKALYVQCVGKLPDQITTSKNMDNTFEEGKSNTIIENTEDDPVALATLTPPNGYFHNSCHFSSKIPHSYTTEFTNKDCHNCNNNGYNKVIKCDLNCENSTACIPPNFDSFRINSTSSSTSLKKSKSVNSALSKRSVKNGLFFYFPSFNHSLSFSSFSSAFNIFSQEKRSGKVINIEKNTIVRLMGAVSFGYGLFHLGISLLPPSLLKVSTFLGFSGNRSVGISNLMYARLGMDMRAPLATLSLLWYYTIVKPFYAVDGTNLESGIEASTKLIEEAQADFANSALFLFFKARVHRMKSNIPEALQSFQASVANTTHQEIRILSLHEIGWCYLIQLEYSSAENTFQILRSTSRWSRSFYAYLETICAGSADNLKDAAHVKELYSFFENIPKGAQLEVLLLRRYKCFHLFDEIEIGIVFWKIFIYELLYLWNTLPNCNMDTIRNIIKDCETITEPSTMEPMVGLSNLIAGYCYNLLSEGKKSIECLRMCLQLRKDKSNHADDAHVSAFAEYELGTALLKTPETAEDGKALLLHISSYKDYDFEQRLTIRIHTLMKHC